MPGPSDIASILSQAGRIEKINQTPFAHADISKQILTEQEARERLRFSREVNESKRVQESSERQHKQGKRQAKSNKEKSSGSQSEDNGTELEVKHRIDVVI